MPVKDPRSSPEYAALKRLHLEKMELEEEVAELKKRIGRAKRALYDLHRSCGMDDYESDCFSRAWNALDLRRRPGRKGKR